MPCTAFLFSPSPWGEGFLVAWTLPRGRKPPKAAVVESVYPMPRRNYMDCNVVYIYGVENRQEGLKMNELMVRGQKIADLFKEKRRIIMIFAGIIAIVGLVWWTKSKFDRAADYDELKKEYNSLQESLEGKISELENAQQQLENAQQQLEDTQERLTYEEGQVELLKTSTNALKEQVAGLDAEKEELNNQLEKLLHVEENVPVITKAILEEQIVSLSELVTKRYMYRNATQKDDDKTWLWGWTMPFSDTSLLVTYDGIITTSIDLAEIKFDVNENTKTITVTMPKSKIFDHNIPQETINVLQVKDNLFNKVTFNDYNRFISAAKIEMEGWAVEKGLLEEADTEAKKIIEAFLITIPGMDTYTLKFQ